jgi:hypothetical protein
MKEIQLTQGKVALVDDEDYTWLNRRKWCANIFNGHWYAVRTEKKKTVLMHAQILGTPKGMKSDHKDGDGLNNQRHNLRICIHAQNLYNQRTQTRLKSSSFKGVFWHTQAKKWQAQIKVNTRRIYLGIFISEIKAARAYDEAARKYFGDFAHTNFLDV